MRLKAYAVVVWLVSVSCIFMGGVRLATHEPTLAALDVFIGLVASAVLANVIAERMKETIALAVATVESAMNLTETALRAVGKNTEADEIRSLRPRQGDTTKGD